MEIVIFIGATEEIGRISIRNIKDLAKPLVSDRVSEFETLFQKSLVGRRGVGLEDSHERLYSMA